MGNETRDYLDGYSGRTADNIVGTITSVEGERLYKYKSIDVRGTRYCAPNSTERYKVNERVLISRPSASRKVLGSMDLIVGRPPLEQRGLSATTPSEERDFVSRAVIITVDPDPLVLELGGDAGTQVITGHGFDSVPATYESATGNDPLLTNASAPVASDTEVTMNVSADAGGLLGDFDAVINGARAPKALRVIRQPVRPYLWASTYGGSGESGRLYQLDPMTLEIIHIYLSPVVSPTQAGAAIAAHNGKIYWITTGLSASRLIVIDPRTGGMTVIALPFLVEDNADMTHLYVDTEDAYGDGLPRLLSQSISPSPSRFGVVSMKLDGTGDALAAASTGGNEVQEFTALWPGRIAFVTFAHGKSFLKPSYGGTLEVQNNSLDARSFIAHRAWSESARFGAATGLFVAGGLALETFLRGTISDLAITKTSVMTGAAGHFLRLVQCRNLIYAQAGNGKIYSYDPVAGGGTGALVTSSLGTTSSVNLATDGLDYLFVANGAIRSATFKRINPGDGAVLQTGPTVTGTGSFHVSHMLYA